MRSVAVGTLVAVHLAWSPTAHASSVAATGFRKLIDARLSALSAGDWAAYRRLLDPRFVHVSDRGERRGLARLRTFVAGRSGLGATYTVSLVSSRAVGKVALVQAEVTERLAGVTTGWIENDVLVRSAGRWVYLSHQETSLLRDPPLFTAKQPLSDFAGVYRSEAGVVDLIALQGEGRLAARSRPDDAPTTLIPVADGAFRVDGDVTVVSFIRDRTGRVVGCFWHLPSGQVTRSSRVDAGAD